MAHIWACPPSEGDDYIFHCHPQEQKIPKPKRLQEWYKKMLDKGMVERIVLDYKVRGRGEEKTRFVHSRQSSLLCFRHVSAYRVGV